MHSNWDSLPKNVGKPTEITHNSKRPEIRTYQTTHICRLLQVTSLKPWLEIIISHKNIRI